MVTALEGVGSWLCHGTTGDVGQLPHDVSLVGGFGFFAGWHAGRVAGAPDRCALAGLGIGLTAGGATWAAAPGATNIVVGLLIVIAAASEVVARRRGLPSVWNGPMLLLSAVAVGFWLAGTPDSPLCDEQSW